MRPMHNIVLLLCYDVTNATNISITKSVLFEYKFTGEGGKECIVGRRKKCKEKGIMVRRRKE